MSRNHPLLLRSWSTHPIYTCHFLIKFHIGCWLNTKAPQSQTPPPPPPKLLLKPELSYFLLWFWRDVMRILWKVGKKKKKRTEMVVKGVLVNNYNVDWNDKMVRVYEMGSACLKYIFFLHYLKPVMLYSVSWLLFCCYKTRSGREQKSFYQKGLTWKAPCPMKQIQILGIVLLTFNRLINLVVMLNSWKYELCFDKNNRK